jgi:hypothetical protein
MQLKLVARERPDKLQCRAAEGRNDKKKSGTIERDPAVYKLVNSFL